MIRRSSSAIFSLDMTHIFRISRTESVTIIKSMQVNKISCGSFRKRNISPPNEQQIKRRNIVVPLAIEVFL